MTPPVGRGRSWLRDLPLVCWLSLAFAIALGHRWLPDANWLMLHLVLLGALTHSILVWSFHFAQTVLRTPADPAAASRHARRLGLLTVGAAAVLIGVPTTWWPLTAAGGLLVAVAVGWHAWTLWRMLRRALPGRFRVTVRYYLWAGGCLLVGVGLGVTLAWGWEDPPHGRLLIAHAMANLLGWVGLTLTGTLLTLWPTMLRTRMDASAELWVRRALPGFLASVAVAVGGALAGLAPLAAAGIVGYLVSLVVWGQGMLRPALAKPPREFAAASVGAGLVWLVIGLAWSGVLLGTAEDWPAVRDGFVWPAAALAAGCGVQVLTGALSYLLPSVLGGGPRVVRASQAWFNRAAGFRLIAINGGLALWLLPTPSWVKVTSSILALGAATAFLPLMFGGVRASIGARRERAEGGAVPDPAAVADRAGGFTAGQLVAGLTALATAVAVGVGLDPSAVGSAAATATVPPTGRVVQVHVSMAGMRYTPAAVTVAAGDRLVVTLVNNDTTTHDLVIGGARSARIAPGRSAELDAGVISESVQGYCSIAGHRQQGMVFDVTVTGAPAPSSEQPVDHHPASQAPAPSDPDAGLPAEAIVNPALAPLGHERVHRVTLTVQEVPLLVAPGVWQRRWTFNGTPVGPTLHGRVGDVFEVTLVNDGSMGHSIDFHAGSLAPDRPMRTIEPGETLSYRFTATKAGVWMYHCSTAPMSAHIAAGMAGAVVIEPDDLPAVDRSYVLVQSEVYLTAPATRPDDATEVDAEGVGSRLPDHVVFNGVANGYDTQRLVARVGERVRFWVLDAGPNRASSFHVVGAQFDTVYSEGGYLLRRGRDAFGGRSGGGQALGLQPAQGGFVEAVFGEAGNYPVVSHVMSDAERGAHGYVHVTG